MTSLKISRNIAIKKNNFILFISIVFLWPLLLHIYGGLFDLLTQGYFYILLIILMIPIPFLGIKIIHLGSEEKSFLFFLFTILIDAFFFNQSNLEFTVKYLLYIMLYIYFFRPYINKIIYYKYFIRFIASIVLIEILLYFILPYFPDIVTEFSRESLSFLNNTSGFFTRSDWDYSLPFYMISYPQNGLESYGILGVPRFYGFSTEPTLFSCVITPLLFIAYSLKEKISFYILLFAFFIASSYGAFAILMLSSMYYFFFKYRKIITLISALIIGSILYGLAINIIPLSSPRLELYATIFLNVFNLGDFISLFSKGFESSIEVPFATFNFLLDFGLIPMIAYLMIILSILRYAVGIDKFIFTFAILFILMLNKSGEILSPLFLFYLNFIHIYKVQLEKNTIYNN